MAGECTGVVTGPADRVLKRERLKISPSQLSRFQRDTPIAHLPSQIANHRALFLLQLTRNDS